MGALGCIWSDSVNLFIFWRVIQAIGIAAIPVVAAIRVRKPVDKNSYKTP